MNRTTAITSGLALAVTSIGAAMFKGDIDYTRLRPDPAIAEVELRKCQVSMAQAIDAALKQTGGVAGSAAFDMEKIPPVFTITTYNEGRAHQVLIDATTGQVAESNVVPRLPGAPVTGEMVTTASGLMYYDLSVGEGKQPAGRASSVRVHYTGWLVDGTKFDSSYDHPGGNPYELALSGVIPGWTEGVGSMNVGGKRKLVVPGRLGYGARGYPGLIPPNAMLIFDIELIEIVGE